MEQIEKRKPGQHKVGKKTKIDRVIYFANGVRAMDMRTQGMSWGEIAIALDMHHENAANTCLKMARDARLKIQEETAEEMRLIHHERYEFMFKSLVPKISSGRERAIEVAAKVLENDAKLMGINADAQTNQGNNQPILIQIQPAPNDAEAKRLVDEARKSAKIIDSQPKLLPPSS